MLKGLDTFKKSCKSINFFWKTNPLSPKKLSHHKIGFRVLVAALFCTLAECVCKGEGADTTDVHVERKKSLARHGETADAARGESTGGKGRRGLEDDVLQRNHRLQKAQCHDGYKNENQRHHDNRVGFVHQRERNGLLVELDTLFSLDSGKKGLDNHEGGGGLDAAARGTRRRPDEDNQGDNHQHRYTYRIDIHDVESCRTAGRHLEKGSKHFVEKGTSVCQGVVVLHKEKEDGTHSDDDKGGKQGNLGADG